MFSFNIDTIISTEFFPPLIPDIDEYIFWTAGRIFCAPKAKTPIIGKAFVKSPFGDFKFKAITDIRQIPKPQL